MIAFQKPELAKPVIRKYQIAAEKNTAVKLFFISLTFIIFIKLLLKQKYPADLNVS